jgi:hypothetical protein
MDAKGGVADEVLQVGLMGRGLGKDFGCGLEVISSSEVWGVIGVDRNTVKMSGLREGSTSTGVVLETEVVD